MNVVSALLALMLLQELEIPRQSRPEKRSPTKHIVALDIGHTPSHPGAISATGIPEYEFNKEVVEKINIALAASDNIQPYIVKSSDDLTLPGRTRLAATHQAELFIAIHHDSAQDKYLHEWEVDGKTEHYSDAFSGYGVFFSRKNVNADASLEFARLLGQQMSREGFKFSRHHAEPIKGENREIVDPKAGVYQFDNLIVLRTARMPAVLLECGVIINRIDEKSLRSSVTQEKIAEAVSNAVEDYFSRPVLTEKAGVGQKEAPEPEPTLGPKLTPAPSPAPTQATFLQKLFGKKHAKQSSSPTPRPKNSEAEEEQP